MLSQVLRRSVWPLLDTASRRALRATCRQLCTVANELIDTLVLPLGGDPHVAPVARTAHVIAALHRRCPGAKTLLLDVRYGAKKGYGPQACRVMAAYSKATCGGLHSVTKAWVRAGGDAPHPCRLQLAPINSLLLALPQLQTVQIDGYVDVWRDAAGVLAALAQCRHLHTLHLQRCTGSYRMPWAGPTAAAALGQLTQLRTLCIDGRMECSELRVLAALPHLERLGVRSLVGSDGGPSAPPVLSTVHTLFAAAAPPSSSSGDASSTPAADSADDVTWSPEGDAHVCVGTLRCFPNLQHLEGVSVGPSGERGSAGVMAAVADAAGRFAGCAERWAWRVESSPGMPAEVQGHGAALLRQLTPGMLAPVRNMQVVCGALEAVEKGVISLTQIVAAAPMARRVALTLMLAPRGGSGVGALMGLFLRPFKRSAQLHTLWLQVNVLALPNTVTLSAEQLVALVQGLLAPAEAGGAPCCPALQHVKMRQISHSVAVRVWQDAVQRAGAMLQAQGCRVQLGEW